MGRSKLDRYTLELTDKFNQGWTIYRIKDWLWKEHKEKISYCAIQHWWTKNTPEAGRRRDIAMYNDEKKVLKETKKTIIMVDELFRDIIDKWSDVKDTLEPKSYEGMVQQMTKLMELRAKLQNEITVGGQINFVIGSNDIKDKRFLEYTRAYVEKHNDKWDSFVGEFASWEKKTYPQINVKDGTVIDVELNGTNT